MKLMTLLLFIVIAFQGYSQISVGPKHYGNSSNFKKGVLDNFKNTKTIFLLSDVYDKEVYEKVLKDSWTVTPFKIVDLAGFEIEYYLNDQYSFAQLSGLKRTSSGGSRVAVYVYMDFITYDSDKILKKLNKLSPKKREKKKKDLLQDNLLNIARFYLYPREDFLITSLSDDIDEIVRSLYTDEVFFNYKPGMLKNYFQKVNNLIRDEEVYWMYKYDYLPELEKLTNNKLYIPSYVTIEYNKWTMQDSEENHENFEEIFSKYDYQYEIISDDELSYRIMNNEEFYYLRYVRMNSERFLQIVNSRTGEIIYRNYIMGLSYKIRPVHINDLNNRIKRVSND